jgi:hypothetical protein
MEIIDLHSERMRRRGHAEVRAVEELRAYNQVMRSFWVHEQRQPVQEEIRRVHEIASRLNWRAA